MFALLLSAFADPPIEPVIQMIDDQLGAFEVGDPERAWKHVAPELQSKFGSADGFWRMVQKGYGPVIGPKRVTYGEFTVFDGQPAQWLELDARDGLTYPALYLLEQQPDGSWRTAGCLLFAPGPTKPTVPSV